MHPTTASRASSTAVASVSEDTADRRRAASASRLARSCMATMREGGAILGRLTGTISPIFVFYPKLQRSWFPPFRRYEKAKAAMYEWCSRLIALRRSRGTLGEDVLGQLMRATSTAFPTPSCTSATSCCRS